MPVVKLDTMAELVELARVDSKIKVINHTTTLNKRRHHHHQERKKRTSILLKGWKINNEFQGDTYWYVKMAFSKRRRIDQFVKLCFSNGQKMFNQFSQKLSGGLEKTFFMNNFYYVPVHFCPFRYWLIWLFRRKRPVSVIDLQWRANLDECKDGEVVADQLCRQLATMIDGRHNDTSYCHMAQCLRGPNIFDQVSSWENCISQLETFVCKNNQ